MASLHHSDLPSLPEIQISVQQLGSSHPATSQPHSWDLRSGTVRLAALKGHPQLGGSGRKPVSLGDSARGVWRGRVTLPGGTQESAAAEVAVLLAEVVSLDGCGTLIDSRLDAGQSLRFVEGSGAPADELGTELGLSFKSTAYSLIGRPLGSVLSHTADLWLSRENEQSFDALLRLKPLKRTALASQGAAGSRFTLARSGPLGPQQELWEETPMVENPRLLQLMMRGTAENRIAIAEKGGKFLVDEETEHLVIHCWCRQESRELSPEPGSQDSVTLEQLLWCDALAALGEMPQCAEAPVPAARLQLQDEGVVSWDELLDDSQRTGLSQDEAHKFASMEFLRQYVTSNVMEQEVLPRLLPSRSGFVRVLSASLGEQRAKSELEAPKPRSLDDLFRDADFRSGLNTSWSEVKDPLRGHDLTSVFLASETAGVFFSFHCLEAPDPCVV